MQNLLQPNDMENIPIETFLFQKISALILVL